MKIYKAFLILLFLLVNTNNYVIAQEKNIDEDYYKNFCTEWNEVYWRYSCIANTARNNNDWKNALLNYKKLAEMGDVVAYDGLASMYYYGRGVPKDRKIAFQYANLAARNGYHWGQSMLSKMYYEGDGIEKNASNAYLWSYITVLGVADSPSKQITYSYLEKIAESIPYDDLVKIKRKAQICKATNYKTCE